MSPLLFYAIMAGLMGYSIHKKWWGLAAFAVAMIAWILALQFIAAYMLHPISN